MGDLSARATRPRDTLYENCGSENANRHRLRRSRNHFGRGRFLADGANPLFNPHRLIFWLQSRDEAWLKDREELRREAIDDLASGAVILMNSYLGIKIDGGEPARACDLYSSEQPLVYKIELIDAAAFKASNGRSELEFHEKAANAAIYYLIDQLSK